MDTSGAVTAITSGQKYFIRNHSTNNYIVLCLSGDICQSWTAETSWEVVLKGTDSYSSYYVFRKEVTAERINSGLGVTAVNGVLQESTDFEWYITYDSAHTGSSNDKLKCIKSRDNGKFLKADKTSSKIQKTSKCNKSNKRWKFFNDNN